jgi:hypothetical protein
MAGRGRREQRSARAAAADAWGGDKEMKRRRAVARAGGLLGSCGQGTTGGGRGGGKPAERDRESGGRSADAVEQAREGNVEATGKAHKDADARVALGAFDASNVREREVGGVRELLLRHAARVTEGADVRAEPAQRVTSHTSIVV